MEKVPVVQTGRWLYMKPSHLSLLYAFFPPQVTNGFELYLCFSPLGTKAIAISAVNKLLKWIRKEEDRLFILSPLTYWALAADWPLETKQKNPLLGADCSCGWWTRFSFKTLLIHFFSSPSGAAGLICRFCWGVEAAVLSGWVLKFGQLVEEASTSFMAQSQWLFQKGLLFISSFFF